MKKLALILIFFVSFSAFSQQREMDQLEILLEKKNPKKEVFYNKSDTMLDVGGYQIPLMFAQYRYLNKDGSFLVISVPHYAFSIYDGSKGEDIDELSIEFASKADVYEAINLMDAIKRY